MSADLIREFFVSLGFKVDQTSLKNFQTSVTKATKAVEVFAAEITGAVAVAAIALDRFSNNLEQLYFSAQRVGSSASSLRAFDMAARNFGTTAGEAQASVEGLAEAINTSPGKMAMLGGLLARVGAVTSSDSVRNMQNLAAVFRQMPLWQANLYAGNLGIDYKMLLAMRAQGFNAEDLRQEGLNAGLNAPAAQAHQLQMQLRDVETRLTVSGAKLANAVMQQLVPALQKLGAWMDKIDPKVVRDLVNAFGSLVRGINSDVKPAVEWLLGKLEALNKATDGWALKLGIAYIALKKLGILGVAGSAAGLLLRGGAAAEGAAGAAGAVGVIGGAGLLASLAAIGTLIYEAVTAKTPEAAGTAKMLREKGINANPHIGSTPFDLLETLRLSDLAGLIGYAGHDFRSWVDASLGAKNISPLEAQRYGVAPASAGALVNNTTINATIHVDGSQSPTDTGRAVADALQRLQRNAIAGAQ